MNSNPAGKNAIEHRDLEFRYDSEQLMELESQLARELADGKEYRRKRSGQMKRRKSPTSSHPSCGFAGRRNHHWNW
jgi:hypothetical protein